VRPFGDALLIETPPLWRRASVDAAPLVGGRGVALMITAIDGKQSVDRSGLDDS
jgi:hypothetical protein